MTRPFLRLIITLAAWKTADTIKSAFPRSQCPQQIEQLLKLLTPPLHHAGNLGSTANNLIRQSKRFTQLETKLGPDLLQHELTEAIREVFPDEEDDDDQEHGA